MNSHAVGGNDEIFGGEGANNNFLYGDAYWMRANAIGGDDVLTAGDGGNQNILYGDAASLSDYAQGGNDVLNGGNGNDEMWGDATDVAPTAQTGADTFVFSPDNGGEDAIGDFRQTDQDKIDVRAYRFDGIADLGISDLGSDTLIDFGSGNSVTLVGIADSSLLTASDFIF
jgi:Ca2+-binding RTX toxin-like protein